MNLQDEAIATVDVQWVIDNISFTAYNGSLEATLVGNLKLGAANFGAVSGEIFEGEKTEVRSPQMKQSRFREENIRSVLCHPVTPNGHPNKLLGLHIKGL